MIVPVPLDAVKSTLTEVVLDTDATPIIGALEIVVTEDDEDEADDVPPELVAETVKVYGVLDSNPDMVIGEDVPVPTSPKLLVTV